MSEMKFSLSTFRRFDFPNLLIDVWSYSEGCNTKNCLICPQYLESSIQAAKEKWSPDFKDCNYIIDNLKKRNKNWFDVSKLPPETKDKLCDVICKWHLRCTVTDRWIPFYKA